MFAKYATFAKIDTLPYLPHKNIRQPLANFLHFNDRCQRLHFWTYLHFFLGYITNLI